MIDNEASGKRLCIGYLGKYAGGFPAIHEISVKDLSFSDNIAFDQLLLAMERNLLIHVTASINMVVVGLAMLRFFSRDRSDFYVMFGFLAFAIGGGILLRGLLENMRLRRAIDRAVNPDQSATPHQPSGEASGE